MMTNPNPLAIVGKVMIALMAYESRLQEEKEILNNSTRGEP